MTEVKTIQIKPPLRLRNLSARGLGLAIEHLPCCILTVIAASIGIPFLSHNPVIELGFAIGGAFVGEYIGHKFIFKHHCNGDACHRAESRRHMLSRYVIALAIGLSTWAAHQVVFHHHSPLEEFREYQAAHSHAETPSAQQAMPTATPAH